MLRLLTLCCDAPFYPSSCTPGQGAGYATTISIQHGRQGEGFPWPSAQQYRFQVSEPSRCAYGNGPGSGTSPLGNVAAMTSPAAFEGNVVALVLDSLLGKPQDNADFFLECVLRNSTGDAHKTQHFPGMPVQDNGAGLQPNTWRTHSHTKAQLVGWRQGDAVGTRFHHPYANLPYRGKRKLASLSFPLMGVQDPYYNGATSRLHHHRDGSGPNQPLTSLGLVQDYARSTFNMELMTDNIGQGGSLNQDAFTSLCESQRQSSLLQCTESIAACVACIMARHTHVFSLHGHMLQFNCLRQAVRLECHKYAMMTVNISDANPGQFVWLWLTAYACCHVHICTWWECHKLSYGRVVMCCVGGDNVCCHAWNMLCRHNPPKRSICITARRRTHISERCTGNG